MTEFPDAMTLGEARQWLRERLDEGADCPCCTQRAQVYRRKLTAASARAIVALYLEGDDWLHLPSVVRRCLPDVAHQGGYMTLGNYWGLIEEERTVRRDDGGRAGFWRVTTIGAEWVRGRARVPKYARIYNGRTLGTVGEPVSLRDALGEGFDYQELMNR